MASPTGEEEQKLPSVDSDDRDERIQARRLRIHKKVEETKRLLAGEFDALKSNADAELTKSRKQIEESRKKLEQLTNDSLELVSNVRIGTEARETGRRMEEDENKRLRMEKIENDGKSGADKFEEITKKWEASMMKEIPQDLHEMLMQQKSLCDTLIEDKNRLIDDLNKELKGKEETYVRELKHECEEIDLLILRMKEQFKLLLGRYHEELAQVERSFEEQRSDLLRDSGRKRDELTGKMRQIELQKMMDRDRIVQECEDDIDKMCREEDEDYSTIKEKLESEFHLLQQQFQQMKATFQLNQEKLEYNLQVLRKRDQENQITLNHQKRRITRLQDQLNNARSKLTKLEKKFRDDIHSHTDDYQRIMGQFQELQMKSKHLISADEKKFRDIWMMAEEEAKQFSKKLMIADRVVHEQQLGLPYEAPDTSFTENVGPIHTIGAEGAPAKEVIRGVFRADEGEEMGETGVANALSRQLLGELNPDCVQSILELICDESGFLVEQKLLILLQPLEKTERNLMKLDAIFHALGVHTEADINRLASYFIAARKSRSKEASGHESFAPPEDVDEEESASRTETDSRRTTAYEEASRKSDSVSVASRRDRPADADLIHPNEVLKALRAFVQQHRKLEKDKSSTAAFRVIAAEQRDDSLDGEYWQKYSQLIDDRKLKLWDAVLDGLNKYNSNLDKRKELLGETESLRQQNGELRMLLHQYINSTINQELEIPPTHILQLD